MKHDLFIQYVLTVFAFGTMWALADIVTGWGMPSAESLLIVAFVAVWASDKRKEKAHDA